MHFFYKDLLRLVKMAKPNSLLDFGSGRGFNVAKMMKRFPHVKITGSDLEYESIREAKEIHPHITLMQDDITKSKQKSNSVDVVTACEVLEHLLFPDKAVKECKRIARNYCIFTVPNEPIWRLANMARLKYVRDLGNTPGHVQNFKREDFEALLKKNFSKVKIINSGLLWNMAICKVD